MALRKPRPWRKAEEIERLTIAGRKKQGLPMYKSYGEPGKPNIKGFFDRGLFGDIYLGRVKFAGSKPVRVAIKRFYEPLTGQEVKAYEKAIQDLRAAGIRLPKTGFYEAVNEKGGREWVQVTQLFFKGGKSKLVHTEKNRIRDQAVARKFTETGAKVINAGYPFWPDMLAVMGKKVIAFDLDAVVSKKLKKRFQENPQQYFRTVMRRMCFSLEFDRATRSRIFEGFIRSLKNKKHQEYARKALDNINLLPENF